MSENSASTVTPTSTESKNDFSIFFLFELLKMFRFDPKYFMGS